MKNNSQETKLDLSPKPKMIKVKRLVFYMLCLVIGIITTVLAYSVGNAGKTVVPLKSVINQDSLDGEGKMEPWYSHVPDKLPVARSLDDDSKVLAPVDGLPDKDSLKKRDESLNAALVSAIKAPDIGNAVSSSLSRSNPNTPITQASLAADNSYAAPDDSNKQNEKNHFLEKILQQSNPDYLHEVLKKPLSPFEVKAGTLIPAVLVGGVNSDLPGQLSAFVSENVYDSVTGRYLLIPQGAKLILQYDSRGSYGQERLLVAVKRLILPNGYSLDLDGMNASDTGGYSGFSDDVDNHYARIFGSGAIMGLITGGFEMSQPAQNNDSINPSVSQVMGAALGQQMGQLTMGMMNKNLDIQPTIKIHPGYEFNVKVTSDLVFPGYYRN